MATKNMHFRNRDISPGRGGSDLGIPGSDIDLTQLGPEIKGVALLTAGDLSYTTIGQPSKVLTWTNLPAGWVSPHQVHTVMAATTAQVCTIEY